MSLVVAWQICIIVYHDKSRQVAVRRARNFFDLGNMPRDRCGSNHIFFPERNLLAQALKMALRAIALNAAKGAGMSRIFVAKGSLFDREGIVVGACRVLSRRVGR